MRQEIQAAFDTLTSEVTELRDTEQAAVAALNGLRQQLADALAASQDPAEIVAAVQGIVDTLDTTTNDLAAAVAANTGGSSSGGGTGGDGEATDPTA